MTTPASSRTPRWDVFKSLFPFGIGRRLGEVFAPTKDIALQRAKAAHGSAVEVQRAPLKTANRPASLRHGEIKK